MKTLLYSALLTICLVGCEQFAEKPNATKAYIVNQLYPLVDRIDAAQRTGLISNEKEDELINGTIVAANLLRPNALLDLEFCRQGDSPALCRQRILNQIEAALTEAANE